MTTGAPLHHLGEVYSAAFSLDGRRVVTASEDATAQVWDNTARVWEASTGNR